MPGRRRVYPELAEGIRGRVSLPWRLPYGKKEEKYRNTTRKYYRIIVA